MKLCHDHDEAIQLLGSDRILLWILAESVIDKNLSNDQIKFILQLKRHQILESLYPDSFNDIFPARKVIILLRRVIVTGAHNELRLIIMSFNNHSFRNFIHWKVIPVFALDEEFMEVIPLLQGSMYQKVIEGLVRAIEDIDHKKTKQHFRAMSDLVHDVYYMDDGSTSIKTKLKKALHDFYYMDELYALHEDYVANGILQDLDVDSMKDKLFPVAPFASSDEISAITNMDSLKQESIDMKYCVAFSDYYHKIIRGECYIYKIDTKYGRATLEVGIHGKDITIEQLRGKNNSVVDGFNLVLIENYIIEQLSKDSRYEYLGEAESVIM